jgi:hypothetical protein
MGTIDSTLHTVECATCSTSEDRKILDKGSQWSGSHWQSRVEFELFQIVWRGGGDTEPEIVSAQCKACGAVASHSSKFGGL